MARLRTTGTKAALLPALLLALLSATACTDSGGEKESGGKPERLKKVWSVPYPGTPQRAADQVWRAKGVLALPAGDDSENLVGVSTSSGKPRWQLPPPKGTQGFCALSERVNAKGVGGALLKNEDGACAVAAAVDVRQGKVLWTEPLSEATDPSSNGPGVSVSDRTLTATVAWREVVRFRLDGDGGDDGDKKSRKLPALPGVSSKGAKAPTGADHDGRHIVLRVGDELALYDADKGTRLWKHHVPKGSHLDGGLVSADPVVLDAAEKGHRFYRAYGSGRDSGRLFGKELIRERREAPITGRGILVARYKNDPRVRAYDMRTGKRAWTHTYSPYERLEGTRGGDLLSTHVYSGRETWLVTRDLRTGAPRTLGRLTKLDAKAPLLAWDSRRVYAKVTGRDGSERLAAYVLPERGSTRAYTRPQEQPGYASGLAAHCEAVTDRSLRHLKFATGRPAPENCEWRDEYEPEGVTRSLKITLTKNEDPEDAKTYTRGKSRADNSAQVVVRHGKVTAVVKASTRTRRATSSLTLHSSTPVETERAARGAAEDVLRSLKANKANKAG